MDASFTGSTHQKRRTARAEGAAWIVRLHGPYRSEALEAGFRAWLAADPENARQFERVTEVWDAGSTPVPAIPRIARWRSTRAFSAKWAVVALLLVTCGLGGWALNELWLNPSYATRLGEQRLVRLPDGTRVSLNSNTRIQVSYREAQRRIRLERGEAIFEVAHDARRPFRVFAGAHRVTALGTTFVVRHETDRTAVTLVEGSVAVRSATTASAKPWAIAASERTGAHEAMERDKGRNGPPELQPGSAKELILTPGERLTFSALDAAKLDAPRIEAITAWRRGEVMLDRTALADAVAEMNRYDETRLVIDGPAVAGLRVSGIYHTGDSELFAEDVARLYGLDVVRQADRIYLRQPSTAGSSQ